MTCIPAKRNLGYGAGVNLAIRRAGTPLVLLLNPDVVAGKGAIRKLVDYMGENDEIGVAGGTLVGEDGRSQMEELLHTVSHPSAAPCFTTRGGRSSPADFTSRLNDSLTDPCARYRVPVS